MIFVTVGTHEQQFDRLIKKVDELKQNGIITEDVFMQIGFSIYIPKYCKWKKMISHEEMKKAIETADIIITHGGPASFLEVLTQEKIAIVVPRLKEYGEHINNHQKEFLEKYSEINSNVVPIYDINRLEYSIKNPNLNEFSANNNNNENFCNKLRKEINSLLS